MSRRCSPSAPLALLLAAGALACDDPATTPTAVPIAATAEAISPTTVVLRFTRAPEPSSLTPASLRIFTPLVTPEEVLAVEGVEVSGEVVTVRTAEQRGGRLYALALVGVRFVGVARPDAPGQVNFEGFGTAPVVLRLDARGFVVPSPLVAQVTLDADTGAPTREFRDVALVEGPSGVWTTTVSARILADRPYAARATVSGSGVEAAGTVSFTVTSTRTVRVELPARLDRVPEFLPPVDPTPGDGKAPVRIVLDDRPARALVDPSLRLAVDAAGRFDLSLSRIERARPVPGKARVFEVVVEVAVDATRRLDGTTPTTFPYVSFLVNDGQDVNERTANFVMPDETPRVVVVPIGNPALVPVTFRVDVAGAFLEPDGRARGKYPGEGIFLTGEFPSAEDALGRLAADAFSGGERATLEMVERPDAPGIFERTIFLPPRRPYGWKVVRCPTRVGCAELNRRVLSSGRAFPTVMKNLTTSPEDAGGSMAVRVVDPSALSMVRLEDGSNADYSRARVSESGQDPVGPSFLFKQEAPDQVVQVGETPVFPPIVVVGTWRDVNIPGTPLELLMSMEVLELAPYDYDDGLMGRAAPTRDRMLPLEPGRPVLMPGVPAYDAADGQLDADATRVSTGGGRLPLSIGWNERALYVATDRAAPGADHFVFVSLDPPGTPAAAHWAKAGTGATSARMVFLAMEGDGDFSGWFRRGDDMLLAGLPSARATVLEGLLDLQAAGLGAPGSSIWVAVVAYGTADGGALSGARQWPAGNDDGVLDAAEFQEVRLEDVR